MSNLQPHLCLDDTLKIRCALLPGDPKRLDCIMSGTNPFAVDVVGSYISEADGVIMLEEGKKRGVCPKDISELTVLADEAPDAFISVDFKRPDTKGSGAGSLLARLPTMFGGRLNSWIQPRPEINKKLCIGCGECEKSCPVHTIELQKSKDGKRRAFIKDENCIKCYCCQELCPYKAVRIKKNPIIKLIGG